jgi:type I restriction enzyme S subunit
MITAVDNCILKPRVNVDPRFIVYQLSSPNFLDYIEGIARGGTRDRISRRMLGDFFVALPPFDEQQAIAVFLDCETAKIDELIAKNERLDDLLREKRSVLIRRVVTGGVDDAAHTVDSGVPSHWVIKQLKHALMFQRGHDLPSSDRVEGTVPVVTSAGPSAWHDRAIAKAPGIVTGRYGTIGVYYFIEQDYWPLNTTLYSISLHGNVPRFLWYMLHALTDIFLLNSAKSAVPGVDRNDLHRVVVAVPPVNEQAEIVDYLDTEVRAVEALMAKVSEAVESLRAYRAAIITAAVTGQINVSTYCSEASCP